VDPSALPPRVKLDANHQMQCTACHDPHDDTYGDFLVMSNRYAALCTSCHQKDGWQASAHAAAVTPWNHAAAKYPTVAENGCEACHVPHAAGGRERLLRYAFEEDNCLVCHNGTTADTDIESQITQPYAHAVQDYVNIHDAAEDFTGGTVPRHVECTDCHNPHQAGGEAAPGTGTISGPNKGVAGIDIDGQPVPWSQNQYEICFKCHGDNNVGPRVPVTRQITQLNVRMEFDPANPSHHAVAAPGANPDVPSLLPPYTINSVISCTDCHNSSSTTGARGPHGSAYEFMLEKNYETRDFTSESATAYELCYKCHSRNSILNDESFKHHKKHIVNERTPCSVCHDPHGISHTQGDATANSHLINFDTSVVFPNSQGKLYFEDRGRFSSDCFLRCHGDDHK